MLFLARAESFQYLFLSLPKDGSKRKSVFDDILLGVCSLFRGLKPTAGNIEPLTRFYRNAIASAIKLCPQKI